MEKDTVLACLAAWLLPGGGHFYLGRWGRGCSFLAVISILFWLGLGMDGRLFSWNWGFFGILKFFAGISSGLFYFASRLFGLGTGDITSYGYEYGNTFLYTAGLMNMLLVVDTFDIARGRKP